MTRRDEMLVRWVHQLPWQLACTLFAVLATADIQALNTSTPISSIRYDLIGGSSENITSLIPLTSAANGPQSFNGPLLLTTDSNFGDVTDRDISFISCDKYPGNLQAKDVLDGARNKHPNAVILFSTEANYCNTTDAIDALPMYSTTNFPQLRDFVTQLKSRPGSRYTVGLSRRGSDDQSGGPDPPTYGQNNLLGPSPSTAVAMIILYSITGIITALFLVIIITGAIRAHRHPDRYGPRDVLGRPRQSRARGLGRAILETLPIVKFGEKEQPKPTDVELGVTPAARDVNVDSTTVNAETGEQHAETRTLANETPSESTNAQQQQAMEEGIAPAQAVATGATITQTDVSSDERLGCSICTDDFEKGQDLRVLPCNHKFHPECVDPWLLNVSGTCPLCRVDLRPVTSNTSSTGPDADPDHLAPDHLAPPLQTDNDATRHRRSGLRDILSFRSRPNASADERISALRRLREQRRNQSGDIGGSANGSSEEVENRRRSNRMSMRLSGVFGARRRGAREVSPAPQPVNGTVAAAPESNGSSNALPDSSHATGR